MEYFKSLFANIGIFVRAMTPSQAIMLIGVIAGIIVGIFAISSWVGTINYSVLYSNLDPADAGEITGYLTDNKIPYKLANGGSSISVPSDKVYDLRITMASEGMPRSGNVGYSIFDQSNLGMTEFLQNLNFRRALEGELMRTIVQLSGVDAARVHIVMPKERLFKEDKKEATASVVLKLRRPGMLSTEQVAGITHLVASSVEGLQPDNITIIDQRGNMLSSGTSTDPLAGLTATQLEVRKGVESYLERKAQTMLDGVVGPGRSIVRVTADLNFQQLEKTSELYDPNSAVIRSEEKSEQTASASDKREEESQSTDENRVETTTTNYEINKTIEHIVNAVGDIERISVAVLLDYNQVQSEESGVVYEPRSQDEIDRLTAIVRNAVGFNADRSDQIEVVNIAFDRTAIETETNFVDNIIQQEFIFDLVKKVGLVLLGIFGLLYFRRKAKKLFTSLGRILPPPAPVRPVPEAGPSYAESGIETEMVEEIIPEKRKPKLLDRMQKTANESPEEFAKVIKTMMVEPQ